MADLIKKPLNQITDVREMLMSQQARDQLSMVASKHMSPERMMRLLANAIRTTPKLGQCHPLSLLGAMMQASSYGWEINTSLGHAFAIPFENKRKGIVEVQLVPGWRGMVLLAHRNGIYIDPDLHYSDDLHWLYRKGSDAALEHEPGPTMGTILHGYAVATFRDDPVARSYVVYPREKIESIRDASQGYQTAVRFGKKDNPWMTHFPAMARKTMVRALFKMLPISGELSDVLQIEDSRPDYSGFALDPMQGLTLEGGVAEEQEETSHSNLPGGEKSVADQIAENERTHYATEGAAAKRPTRAEAQKQYRADMAAAKKASEPGPLRKPASSDVAAGGGALVKESEKAEEAKPAEDAADEQELALEDEADQPGFDPTTHSVYIDVQSIIADGIGADTIRTGLEADLARLREEEPEVYKAVEELLAQAAAAENDDEGFVET
jgi:recombination protein RecT